MGYNKKKYHQILPFIYSSVPDCEVLVVFETGELEYNVDDTCNLLEVDVAVFTVVGLTVTVVDLLARVKFDDGIVGMEFVNACIVLGLSKVEKRSNINNGTFPIKRT